MVDGPGGNLLSAKTAQDLALIQLENTVKGISVTKEPPKANKQDAAIVNNSGKEADIPQSEGEVICKLLEKHKNIFIGEGKIKGQMEKLHLREDITQVLQPQRRVSYHMRKAVSKDRASYRPLGYPLQYVYQRKMEERKFALICEKQVMQLLERDT